MGLAPSAKRSFNTAKLSLRDSRFEVFRFSEILLIFFCQPESKSVFSAGRSPLFNIICRRAVKNLLFAGENLLQFCQDTRVQFKKAIDDFFHLLARYRIHIQFRFFGLGQKLFVFEGV